MVVAVVVDKVGVSNLEEVAAAAVEVEVDKVGVKIKVPVKVDILIVNPQIVMAHQVNHMELQVRQALHMVLHLANRMVLQVNHTGHQVSKLLLRSLVMELLHKVVATAEVGVGVSNNRYYHNYNGVSSMSFAFIFHF